MGKKSKVVGAFISARSHTKAVTRLVKDNLKGSASTEFEASCFGYLLSLAYGQIKFQLQLLYGGMLRMSEVKRKNNVPVFCFNNTMMEFTKKDFYLMTGLKFGDLKKTPTKSEIHTTVFEGLECLKFCDITKAFVDKCEEFDGDHLICLKLALLVFLYGVLLTCDVSDKNIDLRYLHIVDDVDAFNNHPWGVVAYNYLCDSLFRAHDRMMSKLKSNPRGQPKFDIFGFLFALQCWFYEIMPAVGERMGQRVASWDLVYPLILRWTSNFVFKYDEVSEMLDDASMVVKPLKPDRDHESITMEFSKFLTYEAVDAMFSSAAAVQRKQPVKRSIPFPPGESGCDNPPHKKSKLRARLKDANDEGSAPRTRESAPSITTPLGQRCAEVLGRVQTLETSNLEMGKNIEMMMGLLSKLCTKVDAAGEENTGEVKAGEVKTDQAVCAIEDMALFDVAINDITEMPVNSDKEMNAGDAANTEQEQMNECEDVNEVENMKGG